MGELKVDLGPATSKWGLVERQIHDASWNAYINRDSTIFLPGQIDLNPYLHHVKDDSPVLTVCFSRKDNSSATIGSGLPIYCGDKYGSETKLVMNAGNWNVKGKEEERTALRKAFKALKYMALTDPAAYLLNMGYVHFHMLVPSGTGTHMGKSCLRQLH